LNGETGSAAPRTGGDPALRILGGCAIVLGALAALVVAAALVGGWMLTRDEAPGRPSESFLLGDETSYWCLDLKPEDPGLMSMFDKLDASAQAARDEALKNSPLRFLPLRRRGDRISEQLPLKLEIALAPDAWSARLTLTKGTLRARAAMRIMRWLIGRDRDVAKTRDIQGVSITTLRDPKLRGEIAVAMVGNRVLAAGSADRLVRVLDPARVPEGARDPRVDAWHAVVQLDGEDGWAFTAGPSVASFDVDESDALRFRIRAAAASDERAGSSAAAALSVVRSFLPYLDEDAFELDNEAPARQPDGTWVITGRIPDLSSRLVSAFLRFSASRMEGRPSRRWPSASPRPPSPPPSSDPRSGTRAAPQREGTPSPAR